MGLGFEVCFVESDADACGFLAGLSSPFATLSEAGFLFRALILRLKVLPRPVYVQISDL